MQTDTREQVLKRLSYIDGHLQGIRRMVDEDQYCVDVLKQTYAVRRAIEKVESLLLDGHMHSCVIDGIREGRSEQVVSELMELYELNQK
jgi:DNA-binding FrmR family transcriptional regulator